MKKLGLIGGTGWASSIEYYKIINEEINKHAGGENYADLILYSFNYNDIAKHSKLKNYDEISSMIVDAGKKLESIGAEGLVICANTLHFTADLLKTKVNIPIIHIAKETAMEINKLKLKKIGLLGTKQTMERDFYKNKLLETGIKTIIPNKDERNFINKIIVSELFDNIFKEDTRNKFLKIIDNLKNQGAEGIILGCTEIPLLIKQEHTNIQLFDTLEIHSKAAVKFSLDL